MRRTAILTCSALAALAVSACAYNAQPEMRSPRAMADLNRLLAGKVPGKPQTCLPNYRTNDMTVIDEHTVLFRDGSSRTWRTDIPEGCSNLGRPGYTMVTTQYGGEGLCRGQIVRVVDTATGMIAGSCSFGDFVPFTAPLRR